jgi:energy-converting hydrogenase B subunit D
VNELTRGLALGLVILSVPVVVLTRNPHRQVLSLSFYGLILAVLFFALQAPDVALSQLVIGAVVLPLMVLLSLARIRRDADGRRR